MSDEVFSEMMKDDMFFVSHEDDDLIGFVQVGAVNPAYTQYLKSFENNASEIKRLYVLADRQQNGLGSALLKRALQEITSNGCLYLTTWESNHGAQKLCRRFGF